MSWEKKPVVFISYSHDSIEHEERVLALSERLRKEGIDTRLDQYLPGGPIETWSRWMMDQLDEATFVLIVCTETYYRRFRGHEEPGKGAGADWEGTLITEKTYKARSKTNKFIPVLFSLDQKEFIPDPLWGRNYYLPLLKEDYDKLYDVLFGQAGIEPGEIGEPKLKPRRTAAPLNFDDQSSQSVSAQREQELIYLRVLRDKLQNTKKYTQMSGGSRERGPGVEMSQICKMRKIGKDSLLRPEKQPFKDAVKEIRRIRRAVLLGDPGGGKTTIMAKLAADLATDALQDQNAPIPLFIRLKEWTEAGQCLHAYIASQLNDLVDDDPGNYLDLLLSKKRAALLLDGLNELPAGQQRKDKYEQVRQFIKQHQHPKLLAVVSCRELDYTVDLGFNLINIMPLDPPRIRDFVMRYLEAEKGKDLFWELAGPVALDKYNRFIKEFENKLADPEQVFWLDQELPDGIHWGWHWDKDDNSYWQDWIERRKAPSSLMTLAFNPYMLFMLTCVYDERNKLPDNRGELFQLFVEDLLLREYERERIPENEQEELTGELTNGLASVAYEMQISRAPGGETGKSDALTAIPRARVNAKLGERLLYLAVSASILSDGEQVSFTHQLLQEYFAAKFMDIEIRAGRLKASDIWKPDRWWERNNWEEAAILLAGLKSDDCLPVVQWVAEANPEAAVHCINRSGAGLPAASRDALCRQLRQQWLPRLDKPDSEPQPQARAAIGRALGLMDCDNRKGVGVVKRNGVMLPEIEWKEIPEGEFQYGNKDDKYAAEPQTLRLPTFWISRYPVTYRQFQTFLDDPEGFNNPRWFKGMKAGEDERRMEEQAFKFANHPREMVNWYQAMAFCRWLSWRLDCVSSPRVSKGLAPAGDALAHARATDTVPDLKNIEQWKVRLPTEFEWEKAARGTDGRLYPYKGKYDPKKGNVYETGIGQTSAVGIFPNGASPYGVEEMSGNVWEWCLSNYNDPKQNASEENLRTDKPRVLRGGAWGNSQVNARAVYRSDNLPAVRDNLIGFRVVVFRPPSS